MGKKSKKFKNHNNIPTVTASNGSLKISPPKENYISLEKSVAFDIIDEMDPSNYSLVDEILKNDIIKIPIDDCLKKMIFNRIILYYSKGPDISPSKKTKSISTPILPPLEIDLNTQILYDLCAEFPEFPIESIKSGLETANYNVENVRISLLALKAKMMNINNGPEKETNKIEVACEINGRKLEPHMVRSLLYSESMKRTKYEMNPPSDYDNVNISTLIDEANQHRKWSVEYASKASESRSKKSYHLANYFSHQKDTHVQKAAELLNEIFLKKFKIQYEQLCVSGDFDMHGYSVSEATQSMDFILNPEEYNLPPCKFNYINVITGYGAHSQNNQPKIKPTILSVLNRVNKEYHEINSGSIRIKL